MATPAHSASVHQQLPQILQCILQVQSRLFPAQTAQNVTSTGKDQVPRLILCGTPDPGPAGSFPLALSMFSSPQPHHTGSSHSFL